MTAPPRDRAYFDGGALRLDGRALRDRIIADVRSRIISAGSPTVGLATVVVGDDPASVAYVQLKHQAAIRAGLVPQGAVLPADASPGQVAELVGGLNADPSVHGILIQLPLPEGLDDDAVVDLIDPGKDPDGLTATSLGRLVRGSPGFVPSTPLAVVRLLEGYGVPLKRQRVVLVGRTPLVTLPLGALLASEAYQASVSVCDPDDPALAEFCRSADVVVSDAGRPHLIGADLVRPGAAVVDVGISRPEGRLVGDVDTEAVAAVAGALAPNPGGAGPATIACLMENTLLAAQLTGTIAG